MSSASWAVNPIRRHVRPSPFPLFVHTNCGAFSFSPMSFTFAKRWMFSSISAMRRSGGGFPCVAEGPPVWGPHGSHRGIGRKHGEKVDRTMDFYPPKKVRDNCINMTQEQIYCMQFIGTNCKSRYTKSETISSGRKVHHRSSATPGGGPLPSPPPATQPLRWRTSNETSSWCENGPGRLGRSDQTETQHTRSSLTELFSKVVLRFARAQARAVSTHRRLGDPLGGFLDVDNFHWARFNTKHTQGSQLPL